MIKDIISIVGSRYLVAFLNLALIAINARVLGIEGVGTIGLIWASISIIVVVNSILSGSTLVYFAHKYPIRMILPIAYGWIFLGTALGCVIMELSGLLPDGYLADIYLITVLYSAGIANSRFLLAKDHIQGFNLTNILQGGLLFFILMFFYYVMGKREVSSYIQGLYLAHGIALITSGVLLYAVLKNSKETTRRSEKGFLSVLKEMFVYGLWGSADNIAETCTARLNYFLVERFIGLGGVGLLDVGTKVSESVLYISRSIAYIEYNKVAKENDVKAQKRVTLQLFKLSFFVIFLIMGMILLIPEWVYTNYLFDPDFEGIRKVIAALSVAIIAMGSNTIFSHYFIGSGKIKYSTYCSCIGLVTLLAVGYFLIPAYGVIGSAISTSIAFTAMLLFSSCVFIAQTKSRLKDFLPNKEDISSVKKLFAKPH